MAAPRVSSLSSCSQPEVGLRRKVPVADQSPCPPSASFFVLGMPYTHTLVLSLYGHTQHTYAAAPQQQLVVNKRGFLITDFPCSQCTIRQSPPSHTPNAQSCNHQPPMLPMHNQAVTNLPCSHGVPNLPCYVRAPSFVDLCRVRPIS